MTYCLVDQRRKKRKFELESGITKIKKLIKWVHVGLRVGLGQVWAQAGHIASCGPALFVGLNFSI